METILVLLVTTLGNITLELYPEKAPDTVQNFVNYVESGFYEDTTFHRVIDGFMIQGGGFKSGLERKPTKAPIKIEADNGLLNEIGTVAMARTQDPNSATSQFFINVNNNSFLNHTAPTTRGWGYAVFGKVVEGMDVVNKIKKVQTATVGFHQNVPVEDVIIKEAKVLEKNTEKEAG